MPRESYQKRLEDLREDVLYMSEVVIDRVRNALEALQTRDDETAREIVDGDDEINQLYLDLEQDCVDLLALQQPVAGDLRFIAASFKITTDLERIADLAVNLGEYTLETDRDTFPEVDIQTIGETVVGMIEDATVAYADEDTDLCADIAARDDEVDERCAVASDTVMRELIQREVGPGADETEVETLMADVSRLLLTIRDLERAGDHAVNIAARTVYMIENDDKFIY